MMKSCWNIGKARQIQTRIDNTIFAQNVHIFGAKGIWFWGQKTYVFLQLKKLSDELKLWVGLCHVESDLINSHTSESVMPEK